MKKCCFGLLILMLIAAQSYAQQRYILQPYFGNNKSTASWNTWDTVVVNASIRGYKVGSINPSRPDFNIDLSKDADSVFGVSNAGAEQGCNGIMVYGNNVFVSYSAYNGNGGVMVYRYCDLFPQKRSGPLLIIQPGGPWNGGTIGMAIQPLTGDFFVTSSGGIYQYTFASNYTNGSLFAAGYNNAIVANLCFDITGNLWATAFSGTNGADASQQYLLCYKSSSNVLDSGRYYIVSNPAQPSYISTTIGGIANPMNPTLYLLSNPEGIAIDSIGNIWVANNNDGGCNQFSPIDGNNYGSLVEIKSSFITATLLNGKITGKPQILPTNAVSVYHIPNSKLGGLLFDNDGKTLYINDQWTTTPGPGNRQDSNGIVWKCNTANLPLTNASIAPSGIHTTYPGNGSAGLYYTVSPIKDSVPYRPYYCPGRNTLIQSILTDAGTNADGSPAYAFSYKWYLNGVHAIGDTSDNFLFTPSNADTMGNNSLYLLINNAMSEGCTPDVQSNVITLTVKPTVSPNIKIAASKDSINPKETVTFFPLNDTLIGQTQQYFWLVNGINVLTQDTSSLAGPYPPIAYTTDSLKNGDSIQLITNISLKPGTTIPCLQSYTVSNTVHIYVGILTPISFVNLSAIDQNGSVQCHWTVTTPVNTSYFIVERSNNGANFEEIGRLTVKANANCSSYTFSDMSPAGGTNTYRIKGIEKDGSKEYSPAVNIDIVQSNRFTLSPNPAKGTVVVKFSQDLIRPAIKMYDLFGRNVSSLSNMNYNNCSINTQSLKNGVYIVELLAGGKSYKQKLVVDK